MDIVPLLHDELLDGYRGRLAFLNNAESKTAIHQLFRASFPVEAGSDGQSTFVPSLAIALGISLDDLLEKHTMWPLFAAFPDDSTGLDQGKVRYSPVNSSVWLKAARNLLWMCPQCIQSDLAGLYFSYWRRSHQLPGRFFCPEHGTPLRFCATPSFLTASPDALLESSSSVDKSLLEEVKNCNWANATVAILSGILAAKRTIDRDAVTRIFRSYSGLSKGEETDASVIRNLSSFITESLSQDWLRDLMPNSKLLDGDRLQFLVAVLTTARTISLSAAATAIVAAHYMDVREAISSLTLTD